MSCEKCGNQLGSGVELCSVCGTQNDEKRGHGASSNGNPSFQSRKIILLIVGAILIALTAILVVFSREAGSGEIVSRDEEYGAEESYVRALLSGAFAGLADELDARLEGSPFQAVGVLGDVLDNGQININFEHRNREMLFGGTTRGRATILADGQSQNYAIEAVVGLMGGLMNIDLELHINNERAAIRSGLAGNVFYGITYSTFRQDIQHFGRQIGMDAQTMDGLADAVEAIESFMNMNIDNPGLVFAPYIELLTDFIFGLEYTSGVEDFDGGEAHVVEFVASGEDMVSFLHRLGELFREHEQMFEAYLEDWFEQGYISVADILMSVEAFEGELGLRVYLGQDERIFRVKFWLYMEMAEIDGVSITFDFGRENDALNLWTVSLGFIDFHDERTVYDMMAVGSVKWEISGDTQTTEHTIQIVDTSWGFPIVTTLSSLWMPESGRFELSFDDGFSAGSLSGEIDFEDNGDFQIRLDTIDLSPTETLTIELEVIHGGVAIQPIEFINLDQWNQSLLDTINFILNMLS